MADPAAIRGKRMRRAVAGVVCAIAVLPFAVPAACAGNGPFDALGLTPAAPIPIEAFQAYVLANPAAAEKSFTNKRLYFTGRVLAIHDQNGVIEMELGESGTPCRFLSYPDASRISVGQTLVVWSIVGRRNRILAGCDVVLISGAGAAGGNELKLAGGLGASAKEPLPAQQLLDGYIFSLARGNEIYQGRTIHCQGTITSFAVNPQSLIGDLNLRGNEDGRTVTAFMAVGLDPATYKLHSTVTLKCVVAGGSPQGVTLKNCVLDP